MMHYINVRPKADVYVPKYGKHPISTAEIRRGKKGERKKEERNRMNI